MARTLGPFEVTTFLAGGGMGDVHHARHTVEGYDAALKVVRRDARSGDALLNEVRASATLSHPGIVAVYDYGEVTETEARAADGEFVAGSIWFAMEFADRGTLETAAPIDRWSALRRTLLEILDALAHAHARGRVHRDLKPANVLVTTRGSEIAHLLADFGIARVADPDSLLHESTETFGAPAAGTPLYMAPEQIRGQWRDQGPWTDLYALGCMAWELASGRVPFEANNAIAIAMAHLNEEPGPFAARFEVPNGFEDWLRNLLRKPWRARFQYAAHAAHALSLLPGIGDVTPRGDVRPPNIETNPNRPTLSHLTTQLTSVFESVDAGEHPTLERTESSPTPPLPINWRPNQLPGPVGRRTGLGLFGLREIPVQGRERERDLLWGLVLEATRSRDVRVVMIEGSEGRGKSKLLRWLGIRADELGVATVLRASHARMLGPRSGLNLAISRHLECVGLDRGAIEPRVRASLAALGETDPQVVAALTEVIAPAETTSTGPILRFGSPGERYHVISRYLRAEAAQRPVLLLLDDVQWGADALGFVEHLLAHGGAPIAVVTAARPKLLAADPLPSRRAMALRMSNRVEALELEPLPHDHHVALIREQAGLDRRLVDDLLERAGDDTNFSLCVVRDWVARGVLGPSADGYTFIAGADTSLPRDVDDAWGARIDRFCARFAVPAHVHDCLEVAAVLGAEVEQGEWSAACAVRALTPPLRMIPRLIDAGIVRLTELGFEFAQSSTVDALTERARRSGSLAGIHAACAHAITLQTANSAAGAERRALHLLRAGQIGAARAELEVALELRLETSAYDEAIAIADLYLGAATDPHDEAALVVRAHRANALRYRGDSEHAEREALEILGRSDEIGSDRGRGEGLRVLAGLEQGRGRLADGIARYSDAIEAYHRAGDSLGIARSLHGRGWLYLNRSAFAPARADFEQSATLAAQVDARADVAWAQQGLAEAATYDGDLKAAQSAATRAVDTFLALGSRSGHGMALTSLANATRAHGAVQDARATYDAATDLLASFDSQLISFPLLHRVGLELEFGGDDALRAAVTRASAHQMPQAFQVVVALGAIAVARPHEVDDRHRALVDLLRDPNATAHPLIERARRFVRSRCAPAVAARVLSAFD